MHKFGNFKKRESWELICKAYAGLPDEPWRPGVAADALPRFSPAGQFWAKHGHVIFCRLWCNQTKRPRLGSKDQYHDEYLIEHGWPIKHRGWWESERHDFFMALGLRPRRKRGGAMLPAVTDLGQLGD
jgi:hypothetical protein